MTAPGSPAAPSSPDPWLPPAQRLDRTEDLFGDPVADPYRWLEDPASPATRDWLAAQDALAGEQLDVLPGRAALADRIEQLMAAGYISAPVCRGERQFFIRRQAGQEHGVLLTAAPGEPERVLVDPMALDPSGGSTLDAWQPDKEGRPAAPGIGGRARRPLGGAGRRRAVVPRVPHRAQPMSSAC
jgi:prolyl oligopeptidase